MSSKTKLRKSSQSTSRSRSRSSFVSCSSTSHISNSDKDSKDKSSFAKVRKYFDKKFSSLKREMFYEAEESASNKRKLEHEVACCLDTLFSNFKNEVFWYPIVFFLLKFASTQHIS